eukprot:jgi/Antlo1/484/1470
MQLLFARTTCSSIDIPGLERITAFAKLYENADPLVL